MSEKEDNKDRYTKIHLTAFIVKITLKLITLIIVLMIIQILSIIENNSLLLQIMTNQ